MRKLWPILVVLIGCFSHSTLAADQVSIAVMEFSSKGGVSQNQMDALGDMLANEIRMLGDFQVIGKADIRAALDLNEQQSLLGCTETTCIAEIGGALGVRWVMLGNISQFGNTWLLNLKLMDVEEMKVAASYAKSVRGTQDKLIDLLPAAAYEVLTKAHHKIFVGSKPRDLEPLKTPKAATPPPEKKDPEPKPRTAKDLVESVWFSSPKDSGFFLSLNLGASVLGQLKVQHDLQCSDQDPLPQECFDLQDAQEIADGQSRSGPVLALSLGYTFARWMSIYGQFSGAFASGESQRQEPRMARDFTLSAGIKIAWPTDTWIEPLVYAELGASWLQEKDDSDSPTANNAELVGGGLAINLGLGADIYLTPHWFSGVRAGIMVRRWGEDKKISISNDGDGVGFQLLWANGWLF